MITAVDVHAEGEPGRVITAGIPFLPGNSVFEKMQYFERHHDDIRKLMLREPRGNPVLCCNIIVPPCDPSADAGFIIMEQSEYPPMSGSNTICVVTALLETGVIAMKEPTTELTLESPAGLIKVSAICHHGKVKSVSFTNVPAFVSQLDARLKTEEFGDIAIDIAWGGMWFVVAEAAQFGLEISLKHSKKIAQVGEMIRVAAAEQYPVSHPDNPSIMGPTISLLTDSNEGMSGHGAVILSTGAWQNRFSAGVLDRSPCGTGTSARMAIMHARGQISLNQEFTHHSILGTQFKGRLLQETSVANQRAVIPQISGQGWITGIAQYVLDPTDPFPEGYTVSDIWN